MKFRQSAGLAILIAVAIVVATIQLRPGPNHDHPATSYDDITVNGIIGGKIAFFQDPEVTSFLKETYGITVEYKRVPSIDMIGQCKDGLDYCWPSSQTAGETIRENLGADVLASEIIFNSPLVLYTWTPIADALIAEGIVQQDGDTLYIVDLERIIEMVKEDTQWSNIGLPQLYGPVRILTSNPTKSNTGNSFAGLLADTINGGDVVDQTAIQKVLPELVLFFSKLGLLPDTTTLLFEQFLSLGMGACPIIAAYESNLIEYVLTHQTPDSMSYIQTNVRALYPKPTVWTSQPLIALTEGGQRLMTALRDPEIQRIGWENHGFRSANPSVLNDPAMLNLTGVPKSIDSVIPMPGPEVMNSIISALEKPDTGPTVEASQTAPTQAAERFPRWKRKPDNFLAGAGHIGAR